MKEEICVEVKNLNFSFPDDSKNLILKNFSMKVEKGEIRGLLGPNGSGKTTILNLIAGFLKQQKGEIIHFDEKGKIFSSLIFQESALLEWKTVTENIELSLISTIKNLEERRQIVNYVMSLLKLNSYKGKYPSQLSGGLKQRVAIARALAPDPSLLLMDEPFSALDSATKQELLHDIREIIITKNKSAIFITHDQDEAFAFCDSISFLNPRTNNIENTINTSLSINKKQENKIRLGYMPSWAEGTFPVVAMKNGKIAENNGLDIQYIPSEYGPPLVEGALARKYDVIFTGWVPAVSLMSKSDDWVVVSKLAYFPMALMARNGSNIKTVEDLKGKKVGVGYGSGPYPLVITSLKEAGLEPGKDVQVINMKPADMGVALKTSQVDAVSWAEPSITLFKEHKLAHIIEEYEDIGFILFSKQFVKNHPEDVRKFLKAFKESQVYISQKMNLIFKWFSDESQYDISLVKSLKVIEPNFKVKNIKEVDISINKNWIKKTQTKINFEYEEKIIDKKINLVDKIDLSYL